MAGPSFLTSPPQRARRVPQGLRFEAPIHAKRLPESRGLPLRTRCRHDAGAAAGAFFAYLDPRYGFACASSFSRSHGVLEVAIDSRTRWRVAATNFGADHEHHD